MKEQIFFPLFFGAIILVACQTRGETNIENMSEEQSAVVIRERLVFEDGVVRMVVPEPLCSFTVEVYPKVLRCGDPLYVRLNYKNNTDTDAHAYADANSIFVGECLACEVFAFHLMANNVVIPWKIPANFGGQPPLPIWEKVKAGEKGPTQYTALIQPGAEVSGNGLLVYGDWLPQWSRDAWKRINTFGSYGGVRLLVVVNSRHATLAVASPQFDIVPRGQEEMQILGLDKPVEERTLNRQNIERIIPKTTPGTLQNLLKYELLLLELMELVASKDEKCENLQIEIHEALETIETFLQSLNEIEREGLRRAFYGGNWITETLSWKRYANLNDSEKIQKRLIEVFGERFVPLRLPNTGWSGGIEQ